MFFQEVYYDESNSSVMDPKMIVFHQNWLLAEACLVVTLDTVLETHSAFESIFIVGFKVYSKFVYFTIDYCLCFFH